jgi:hypothetical protein
MFFYKLEFIKVNYLVIIHKFAGNLWTHWSGEKPIAITSWCNGC